MSLTPYKSWIFCPTCALKIKFGVDTEFSSSAIESLAIRSMEKHQSTTFDVPIEFGHICDGKELKHINKIMRHDDHINYQQFIHPIIPVV
jgi:hypothetical protein